MHRFSNSFESGKMYNSVKFLLSGKEIPGFIPAGKVNFTKFRPLSANISNPVNHFCM